MKKILLALLIVITGFYNSVLAATWPELSQSERNEYIEKSLEDIREIDDTNVEDELLNTFELKTNRDPNFKKHTSGRTTLKNVAISNLSRPYMPPGPTLLGERYTVNVPTGYTLSNGKLKLSFNNSGHLTEITATSTRSSYGTYVEKKYNKSRKLEEMIYYDNNFKIIFNGKNKVERIYENGNAYNIKGERLE